MFQTEVKIDSRPGLIAHTQKMWTIGSCFADEIGSRLADRLFDIRVNPMGTLYNPVSVARSLDSIITGRTYSADSLLEHNGLWHSPDFHSDFSGENAAEVLARINNTVTTLAAELPQLDTLMVTFGSARMFVDRATSQPVANCHKLPASQFEVRDLTVNEIAPLFGTLIARLRSVAPQLKLIFTVSPIRHASYGMHADRLSKATLLLAVDRICREIDGCTYFPAYEIMNDELRDYRFYAADMIHPSQVACDHIYNRFAQTFFAPATATIANECERFTRRIAHRPRTEAGCIEQARAISLHAADLCNRHPELSTAVDRLHLSHATGS